MSRDISTHSTSRSSRQSQRIRRTAVLHDRLHLAGLGIRRDPEIPRRVIAEDLGLAIRPGEQEDPPLQVVRQCERGGRRRDQVRRVGRSLCAARVVRDQGQTPILVTCRSCTSEAPNRYPCCISPNRSPGKKRWQA